MLQSVKTRLTTWSETAVLRAFAVTKVPLLAWVRPRVTEVSDERCTIKIPLRRRTKNHLGSMYFAVLAAGADAAGGYLAMHHLRRRRAKVHLVFKDFHADFLARAEADTYFTCADGLAIADLVDQTLRDGQRHHLTIHVVATCPSKKGDDPIARFSLTLSLKRKR